MSSYFQGDGWPPFSYLGTHYPLDHLNEFHESAADDGGIVRHIAVTFEDHCFTREPDSSDHSLIYPLSTRKPGHFCFERYGCSMNLPAHVKTLMTGKVWNVEGDFLATLPLIDLDGAERVYRIVFGLRRVKNLPVDLHMRVETAYPADDTPFATYGDVRFPKLVSATMNGRIIRKNFDRHRRVPRVY